jgi:hypothetical protein
MEKLEILPAAYDIDVLASRLRRELDDRFFNRVAFSLPSL